MTLLNCVAMDGDMIGVQFIFKGKLKMKEWARHLRHNNMDIEVSESGWADNEIGLVWFKKIFEPQSKRRLESEDKYRLLFLDGHSLHISRNISPPSTTGFQAPAMFLLNSSQSHSSDDWL